MLDINKAKEFRTQLLKFIEHNISVGYMNNETTLGSFKNFVETDLEHYINAISALDEIFKA